MAKQRDDHNHQHPEGEQPTPQGQPPAVPDDVVDLGALMPPEDEPRTGTPPPPLPGGSEVLQGEPVSDIKSEVLEGQPVSDIKSEVLEAQPISEIFTAAPVGDHSSDVLAAEPVGSGASDVFEAQPASAVSD